MGQRVRANSLEGRSHRMDLLGGFQFVSFLKLTGVQSCYCLSVFVRVSLHRPQVNTYREQETECKKPKHAAADDQAKLTCQDCALLWLDEADCTQFGSLDAYAEGPAVGNVLVVAG